MKFRVLTYSLGAIIAFLFSLAVVAAEPARVASAASTQDGAIPLQLAAAAMSAKVAQVANKSHSKSSHISLGSANVSAAFKKLDSESESVLKQVLNLGTDLAIEDEREHNPPKTQLLVMVSMQPTDLFELDLIELRVDKQVVVAHHYTHEDVSALKKGGSQRLYLANLPAGTHHLKATMLGKIPRDPDYRKETSIKFVTGVNRQVINLDIASGTDKGYPSLVAKEWK